MKNIFLSLLLVVSLQGTPLPAQASNGMTDVLSTMMQLFLWMMSSGGGSGMSGFGSNGMNPLSMNPYGFGGRGYQNQWGGYPGRYGGWGSSPYSQYGYGGRSPYFGSYNNSGYNRYGVVDTYNYPAPGNQGKPSALVIQPIIVSPGQGADGTQVPKIEYLPAHSVEPVKKVIAASTMQQNRVLPPPMNNSDAWDFHNPLLGRWQGVNGEFLELGNDRFRLRSRNADMQGTYQLKNGIMKAAVFNSTTPVYMQFRMAEGQLVFRSENGEMMLFRRLD